MLTIGDQRCLTRVLRTYSVAMRRSVREVPVKGTPTCRSGHYLRVVRSKLLG